MSDNQTKLPRKCEKCGTRKRMLTKQNRCLDYRSCLQRIIKNKDKEIAGIHAILTDAIRERNKLRTQLNAIRKALL